MQDEKINGMDAGAWRYDRPDGMWGGKTTSASSEQSQAVSEAASEAASSASESSVAADLAKEQEAADLSATEAAAETETAAAEQVLLDNDLVQVTLKEKIKEDYYIGYSALIENKSADQYLLLGIDQSSVDGLMTYIDVQRGSVAPGKKSKAEFRIYTDDSDIKTLDDLKNVEGVFTISTNTDGGNSYTQLKDKYPFTI